MKSHALVKITLIFLLVTAGNCFVFDKTLYAKEIAVDLSGADSNTSIRLPDPLSPEEGYRHTCQAIVRTLKYHHYNCQKIDDRLSDIVFERYLLALDTRKINFLSSDIEEFDSIRYGIDDALKKGDTNFIFLIFNKYRNRAVERISFMIHQVKSDLNNINFDKKESLEKDREESAWLRDKDEQVYLWKKYFKYDVLNLMLAEKQSVEIQNTLEKKYRNQLKRLMQLDSEDAFSIFINALSHCYDPHTSYLSPRSTKNFNIMMSLSLEGIGAVLQREDEYTKVVRLIPAGPADKSKCISPGDFIVGVGQNENGEIVDVIGWRLDDVVELIRGPEKTVVRLELIPSNAIDEYHREVIRIVRDTVRLEEQAVRSKVIDIKKDGLSVKIGIISIPSFYVDFDGYESGKKNYKSTARDVYRILKEMARQGVDGILVDLRDNGGGALKEAISMTGLFIKKGPIVQLRDNRGNIKVYPDPDPEIRYNGPLVVLVNRLSASASEIFAGAIQDYNRGVIIGSRTYGKGTVQAIEKLPKGQLKLTNAIFYRASGESTQHRGIVPDIIYPSIYDNENIGESALKNAIPWDKIHAAEFSPRNDILSEKHLLKSRHKNRVKDDLGFDYLESAIQHLKEVRRKKEVTLNKAEREKGWKKAESLMKDMEEIKKTAIEKAGHMKELTTWLKGKKDLIEEGDEADIEDDIFDPMLFESCNILVDLINIDSLVKK
ncbi:MAG: carboxy terminal-processing peptidase [Deltaproteobacteria bacterium]|nr:carboxy terminal-processing peptidase [Deltaproteobacteria bacterium]